MKLFRLIIVVTIGLAQVATALAQGTVWFRNDSNTLSSPPDRLVRFGPNTEVALGIPAGTAAYGTNVQMQLYYGASTAAEASLIEPQLRKSIATIQNEI